MRTTQQMSITLPNEMAAQTKARDRAVEKWLREDVVPAAEKLRANPASGISGTELRATMAAMQKEK